jgi:hypothetical protein
MNDEIYDAVVEELKKRNKKKKKKDKDEEIAPPTNVSGTY